MLSGACDAFERWLAMGEPDLGAGPLSRRSTTRTSTTTPRPRRRRRRRASTRSIRRSWRPTRSSASRCGSRRSWPACRARRVAVDAVFDSVSVVTTFKEELAKAGVIFCSMSEAIREHPELVRKYLGTVVPVTDNFFACLNSAVFSDGSFVYVPPGVRCPMELSTYFRINAKNTGQFERTLIIADKGAYVTYLEGCTAPQRDENQLHAAVVELVALDDAEIKYSTVQNWYPGDAEGKGGIYNFVTKRGDCRGRELEGLLDAGRDRLGDHLEVPVLHPARRGLARRVLLDRHDQRLPAGRQRHQDDPPRQEHDEPDHLQGHLGRPLAQHLSRPGLGPPQGHERAQLHPVRLPADRQQLRRPHRALHRGAERPARCSSTRRRRRRSPRTSCSTACSAGSRRRRRRR